MKTIHQPIDDSIVERKKETGLTWKALIVFGLDAVERTKAENKRITEMQEEIKHLHYNIGRMQELLRNKPSKQ